MNIKRKFKLKTGVKMKGSYVVKTYEVSPQEQLLRKFFGWCRKPKIGTLISTMPAVENLIMVGTGYGANLILRALVDDSEYPKDELPITYAAIGSGTTPPAISDTGLETPVLSSILKANTEILSNSSIVVSFFIPDGSLANGTYNEFGIFNLTLRLFARSIISPAFVKASNQDTTVDYTISYV